MIYYLPYKTINMCFSVPWFLENSFLILIYFVAEGKAKMTKAFSLCTPLLNDRDVARFKNWMASNYDYMSMVDYPYAADFLAPLPGNPIKVSHKYSFYNILDLYFVINYY